MKGSDMLYLMRWRKAEIGSLQTNTPSSIWLSIWVSEKAQRMLNEEDLWEIEHPALI